MQTRLGKNRIMEYRLPEQPERVAGDGEFSAGSQLTAPGREYALRENHRRLSPTGHKPSLNVTKSRP
jgi:hypothetical protein